MKFYRVCFRPKRQLARCPKGAREGQSYASCPNCARDVEEAFKKCAAVVEGNYSTPFIEHGFLEPESGIGYCTPDGGVTIEIGTQTAFDDRTQLSEILALPPEKIRVIQLPIGGAFGAKEDMILQQYLALGA